MGKFRKLTHVFYKCEYYIVFTPKYQFRVLNGLVKTIVEHGIKAISQWEGVEVEEVNIQDDHIHIVCSIPPTYSISEYMGLLKGKLAIKLFKTYPNLKRKPYWKITFGHRDICK